MTVRVRVTGIPETLKALDPETFARGLRMGLQASGDRIGAHARQTVHTHHWHGTFEQAIHTEIKGSGLDLEAHVGVSSSQVPHARPLSYGWKSQMGKRPPTQAIAKWLTDKPEMSLTPNVSRGRDGFVKRSTTIANISREKMVRQAAFLIARSIAKKGYGFPPLKPFEKAWDAMGGDVPRIIRAALRRARDGG